MEESKQIPEETNSIESSSEIKKESNKEENVKAFTEFLEKASNQESNEGKINPDIKVQKQESNEGKVNPDVKVQKQESINYSLFQRILNDGFDGISSNPNHKMLALLLILLINLSLFFVIGNLGKAFLRNAGIM